MNYLINYDFGAFELIFNNFAQITQNQWNACPSKESFRQYHSKEFILIIYNLNVYKIQTLNMTQSGIKP